MRLSQEQSKIIYELNITTLCSFMKKLSVMEYSLKEDFILEFIQDTKELFSYCNEKIYKEIIETSVRENIFIE